MQKLLNNIKSLMSETLHRFPVTSLFVMALTILNIIFIITEDFKTEWEEALAVGAVAALLAEIAAENNFIKRREITIGFSALLLAGSGLLLHFVKNIYSTIAVAGVGIALSALIAYLIYRKSTENILSHLIKSVFLVEVFTSIIFSGFTVCLLAFNSLLIKLPDIMKGIGILSSLAFILCGTLMSISYIPRENDKLIIPQAYKTIIHKALFYVYLLLIGILYLYILKTIIIHKMPVGRFNWFGCFALLFFILFYLTVNDEDGIVQQKFKQYGAFMMLPILAIQILGIYIRVSSYGLTLARFLSILFIISAVVFLVLVIAKKPVKYYFLCVAMMALVFTCTPFNVVDIPVFNQEQIIKNELTKAGALKGDEIDETVKISPESLQRINSAYSYIKDSDAKKGKYFTAISNSKKMLSSMNEETAEVKEFSFYNKPQPIDISEYKTLYEASGDSTIVENSEAKEFFLSLEDGEKEIIYRIDNKAVVFTYISYTYDELADDFRYIDWEGYVLEK